MIFVIRRVLLTGGDRWGRDVNGSTGNFSQVIGDKNNLYFTLTRNLYHQRVVLGKKYRLLKIAYNVFMFGIVVSVIAFFIASKR